MKAVKAKKSRAAESGGPQLDKKTRGSSRRKNAAKGGDSRKASTTKKKTSRKVESTKPGLWFRFREYLREVVYELRKVVWPSRKETIGSTAVVLVIVILCGLFLGFVDLILSRFVRFLIG